MYASFLTWCISIGVSRRDRATHPEEPGDKQDRVNQDTVSSRDKQDAVSRETFSVSVVPRSWRENRMSIYESQWFFYSFHLLTILMRKIRMWRSHDEEFKTYFGGHKNSPIVLFHIRLVCWWLSSDLYTYYAIFFSDVFYNWFDLTDCAWVWYYYYCCYQWSFIQHSLSQCLSFLAPSQAHPNFQ